MSTGWDPSSPYPQHLPYPDAMAYAYEQARARVQVPAVLLIVVALVNVVLSLLAGAMGLLVGSLPIEDVRRLIADMDARNPGNPMPLKPEDFKSLAITVYGGIGAVGLAVSVVLLIAGIRMRMLQSYALSMTGAILAAVPCISCSSCFGLGEVAGIWALVVLIDPSVRMAFYATSLPPGQYPMPQQQQQQPGQQPTPQQPIQPTDPTTPQTPGTNDNIQPGGQQ